MESIESLFSQFLFEMSAKVIVKEPNRSKNQSIPSCIDLVITNISSKFQHTKAKSTG